jgi:hypothetical protein
LNELKSVLRFAIHAVVGVALFAIVAGAALLLTKFGEIIAEQHASPYISITLNFMELFIFFIDTILFVVFLLKEAYVLLIRIVRSKGGRGE